MNKLKMKIGYAPTRRFVFSIEEAQKYKNLTLESIQHFDTEIVDINDINEEGLLFDSKDVEKIINKFKHANVDGVFFPHCNFGSEDLVAKVAKAIGKPVLIWGPRDDEPLPDGLRTRDTQCGLFATGKVLRRFNVPFTYIVNSRLEDKVFERGFKNFIATCAVIRAFSRIKILQVAPRPAGFWTMICNEGELLEKFGIEVFPITLQDVATEITKIMKEKALKYQSNLDYIKSIIDCSQVTVEAIEKFAALKTMVNDYCEKENCTAAAIQCWTALQDTLGIMPCIANGLLFDEGIPATCETDLHGAISSIVLQEATMRSSAVFLADLTVRHPNNDNAELLWHCGNFPPSLAKEGSKTGAGYHFIFPSHCPGTGEWELKNGAITICRFDGDHGEYSLLIGEGKGVKGPKTKGTYVWFEVKDWPKWEEKIVTGPYVHHCAGVHAKVAAVLYESCKYIPGLKPDPIEPTEEEIQRYLRGQSD
jgi:L-fucose isomerase-like protein